MNDRQPVHAAILAAGLSSRFGGRQKALHRVGDRTLLERSLDRLMAAGVASATVVVGHRRADVDEVLRAARLDAEVHVLLNERYADWNNFYSVELLCERLPPGEVLVVNGDILYSAEALRSVLRASGGDLYLAVSEEKVDQEAMKVSVDGQRVVALGKTIDASSAKGEFIGISRLAPAARAWYSSLSRWGRVRGLTSHYYEDIYDGLCSNLAAVACSVDATDWAEIDEAVDLPRAQAVADRLDSSPSTAASRSDARPL
jgi:choline kinase